MPQLFSVQMNIQDIPKVQIEQAASPSQDTPAKGSKNSFNSILQNIIPKETNHKTSSATISSSNTSTDESSTTGITKTSEEIADILLLSKDQTLRTQISALLQFFNIGTPKQLSENSESGDAASDGQFSTAAGTVGDIISKDELIELLDQFSKIAIPSEQTSKQESSTPSLSTDQFTGTSVPTDLATTHFSETAFGKKQTVMPYNEQVNLQAISQQEKASAQLSAKEQGVFAPTSSNFTDTQDNLTSVTSKASIVDSAQTTVADLPKFTPVTITKEMETFLERVQNILNNSTETGTLSIKNVTQQNIGSPLRSPFAGMTAEQAVKDIMPATVTATTTQGNSLTTLQEGVFAPTLTPRQTSLHGVRHDSTQHFYDTKIQPENVLKDAKNLADTPQDNEMSQPGSGFSQLSQTLPAHEGASTFSIPGTATLDPVTGQLTDPARTTLLPSGTVVQDLEVLQQFVERFQLNRRQLDTKIQLKLHPAELGEMEIDLTVKEGSIRANVVAQSQHVQQILERNLLRLKSVLEQQGFNVEEITVTTASEMINSSDLFDQQLPNRDFSGFLSQDKKAEAQTPFILDAFQENQNDSFSGVNVKV